MSQETIPQTAEQPKYLRNLAAASMGAAILLAPQLLNGEQDSENLLSDDYTTVQAEFDPAPENFDDIPYPGWAECEFKGGVGTNNHCRSFHSTASVYFDLDVTSTNQNCVYTGEIQWGDGTTTEYSVDASEYEPTTPMTGESHSIQIGSHTFGDPGRYSIHTEDTNTTNSCQQIETNMIFDRYEAPMPPTCENKFNPDFGRAYMYSLMPKGELTRVNGQPLNNFEYIDPDDAENPDPDLNVFVDEAGVRWNLLSPDASIYHQPDNYENDDDQAPYKKFVTDLDSLNGSFEIVLMPDGAPINDPGQASYENTMLTYQEYNWLWRGHGLPTYNHVDFSYSWYGHLMQDLKEHQGYELFANLEDVDDRYVPIEFWLPEGADWRTFRERFQAAQAMVERGAEYVASDDEAYLLLDEESLVIASDLQILLEEFLACQTEQQEIE